MDTSDDANKSKDAEDVNLTGVDNDFGPTTLNVEDKSPIDTLEASKKRFSKRDQLKAELVRRFQHVAGVPSDETIIHSVNTNGIRNNPLTKRDALIAYEMVGRSEHAAQGKTKRCQPSAVDVHLQTVEVPIIIK